jgi:hypothetical protein
MCQKKQTTTKQSLSETDQWSKEILYNLKITKLANVIKEKNR